MEFFDREREVAKLREIRARSRESATLTVMTGRRRVGKTELVKRAFADEPFVYLFVTRSAEADLCDGFKSRVEAFTGKSIPGRITHFHELFRLLLELAAERPVTVVIDEFQDFFRVNPAIYSEMQREWDELSGRAKINLVVTGSVNTLMNKIFKEQKEPLFGRDTDRLTARPFGVSTLKEILARYHLRYTADDLLALWAFTGGVAKYVSILVNRKAFTRRRMIDVMIEEDSYFLDEGWAVLVEEFGKDYGTYFSILSAIARGKTSRAEIMNEVAGDVGGYLTRLEEQFGLIAKNQPLFEKTSNKGVLYKLNDNFFRFWFRFIFKHQYLIQVGMFDELRELVARDYEVFSGHALEGLFQSQFAERHAYSRMGGWWDRKGENEIDLVCENEFRGTLDFYEVKREKRRFDRRALEAKVEAFFRKNPEKRSLAISLGALSLADV
jgi:uncharacterized protein